MSWLFKKDNTQYLLPKLRIWNRRRNTYIDEKTLLQYLMTKLKRNGKCLDWKICLLSLYKQNILKSC